MDKNLKWHSQTGYCKFCGCWVGYTPKDVCEEYEKVQFETTSFKKSIKP